MTTFEFRQDADRVAEARRVLSMPIVQEMIAAMEESGPHHGRVVSDSKTGARVTLGVVLGYTTYADEFKKMASISKPGEQIDTTYEDKN